MNNTLKQDPSSSLPSIPLHKPRRLNILHSLLHLFTWMLIVLALVTGILLLGNDIVPQSLQILPHAPLSASPLLLIGAASAGFLILTRPKPLDLFKALLVSLAFILWGIDQLLPASWLATILGDTVITLYVVDLGWMMVDRLRSAKSQGLS